MPTHINPNTCAVAYEVYFIFFFVYIYNRIEMKNCINVIVCAPTKHCEAK